MQQRQSLHGKANNLLQHSREDDANQGSAILVLELPSDVEAEAGVPGGNGQLDVVSVLGPTVKGQAGLTCPVSQAFPSGTEKGTGIPAMIPWTTVLTNNTCIIKFEAMRGGDDPFLVNES